MRTRRKAVKQGQRDLGDRQRADFGQKDCALLVALANNARPRTFGQVIEGGANLRLD